MNSAYEVILTQDALTDLEDLYSYIAEHDAPAKADYVLDRLDEVVASLSRFPERGTYTKELVALGIREYRETYFKPYRVVYRVVARKVYVYLIVDGRRDMQTLLQKRLLRA